ncbi:MAG: TetR/AcrR family transcriptional regulator [Thermodesulfobacteriota bacterium]
MARNKNSSEKIKKITDISRSLFIENGYESTSVRDILKEAQISTGSLYNFFRNKEEILLSIYIEILDQIHQTSEEITSRLDSPLMKFSVSIALQTIVFLNNLSRKNIYFAAFQSRLVNEYVIHQKTYSVTTMLKDAELVFTGPEIRLRTVALNASVNSVLEECLKTGAELEDHQVYSLLIRISLAQFDVPDGQIDSVIRKTRRLVS